MLRMPDPIHPDLPCLFAGAIVPALCSVVIPDACAFYILLRFLFGTFLMRHGKYGVGSGLWPFPPRCVSFVCVERSRVSISERATRAWPIKGVEDLSENYAA